VRNQLFKKKNGFVEKAVGNEIVIVPLVGKVAQMEKVFSLNEIGAFIYNCLNTKKTTDELLSLILNEFEIDRETALNDLELFISKAVKIGIVEELKYGD